MDCSLSGSSVHGILQARILEWVAISFSSGIFGTQGLNLGLPHCRQTLYILNHQGSPKWKSVPFKLRFYFLGLQITKDDDWSHEIKIHLLFGSKAMTHLDSVLKSREISVLTEVHIIKYSFPSSKPWFSCSHIWLWELGHKEGWVPKNGCFWIVVLAKTLESPLDRKEIKPINPKANQPWTIIGRTDPEIEAPILWPPDVKSQHTRKDPDNGKDWRQKEKGAAEDEMVEWHHWLNGHEFEQALGDS